MPARWSDILRRVTTAGPYVNERLNLSEHPAGHLEVKLVTEKDIDGVLLGWLRDAYDLCP